MSDEEKMEVLDRVRSAVAELQEVDITTMSPADQLRFARSVEVLRRRLEHGADRVTGHLDATAAFSVDGHRNVRTAVTRIGRLTGAEALGRTQTIRALQLLPLVEIAHAAGRLPIGHVRLIARVAANPRVHQHLEAAAPLFVDRAQSLDYDAFHAWMQQWLFLADPDGADRDDGITHEKRRCSLIENFDGSWTLEGQFGALQGSVAKEILDRFEQSEFEGTLRRACGDELAPDPNADTDGRVCHTMGGTLLHPSDVLAAAMVGLVRRVVVDAAGTVIDLGRRRRLFTGSSREAAMLQAFLRSPGGLGCLWPGCNCGGRQADHRLPAAAGGATDLDNCDVYCGFHNRLKEHGFKPVRDADGTWTMYRPDGDPITPAA